jgi:hypothetical protein
MASQPDATSSVDLAHIAFHMAASQTLRLLWTWPDIRKMFQIRENGHLAHIASHMAGQPDATCFCGPRSVFENFSKSGKMASLEEKSDQFARRKIQGFGSGNFAECLEMLQKFKIRENDQF